jgi:hypothetical protein
MANAKVPSSTAPEVTAGVEVTHGDANAGAVNAAAFEAAGFVLGREAKNTIVLEAGKAEHVDGTSFMLAPNTREDF